jgi:multidrug efflux pump subunit AcrB
MCVAFAHDGSPPQTNVVQLDGRKGVLMTVLKTGTASTLDIIAGIKELLPRIQETLPPDVELKIVNDQSGFVKASVLSVVREGVIAAGLTGLMILLFLGSWRSTLIISISIPLSILAALPVLVALGETINVMTLGGFALAVGMLVDEATVTIENVNWHLEHASRSRPPPSTMQSRSSSQQLSRCFAFALFLFRCSDSAASRGTCSGHSRKRSSSR